MALSCPPKLASRYHVIINTPTANEMAAGIKVDTGKLPHGTIHMNPYTLDTLSTFFPIVCTVVTKAQANNVDSLNRGFEMVTAATLAKGRIHAFEKHVIQQNKDLGATSQCGLWS